MRYVFHVTGASIWLTSGDAARPGIVAVVVSVLYGGGPGPGLD